MSKDADYLRKLAAGFEHLSHVDDKATATRLSAIADKLAKMEDDAALLNMQTKFKVDVREANDGGWETISGHTDVAGKRSPREALKAWRRKHASWLPASMLKQGGA